MEKSTKGSNEGYDLIDDEYIKQHKSQKKEEKKLKKIKYLEEKKERQNERRQLKRKEKKERIKIIKKEALEHPEENIKIPYRKKKRDIKDIVCTGKVFIDCDYEELMEEKDIKSLFKEIEMIYSFNHKQEHPFELIICGVGSSLKKYIDKHPNTPQWRLITFTDKTINQLINTLHLPVYLTAESSESLKGINDNDIFIIGGLVDHKQHKGVSQQKAESLHLPTLKLPIEENISSMKNIVMATNHVFETLCRFKQSNNWKDSLEKSIPSRYFK
ncbi:hypothetical protein ENUP19_0257G0051 [Entamoeba nuttalli]|uniref:tRNA (guanine(9)-N(1))-methyltransferase n=2 Tax=Entamoeba nuttalli TaxID=412467 RepID=K2H016_ENTNP|nr:tRNA (guanine-N1-)-methyltransferase [Entamoeba nuttalli P19]EKE39557.1 tRNA (guanine-N1-)-methyltransferase [Entamoeba nuttalli P19]|eukprot:XP_008858109.1 tRNA (guanine-N1-)-methyltransferase [Entamoeba nuttalli P19]